eukprot:16684-Pelagococcus_subviridis.AAC.1
MHTSTPSPLAAPSTYAPSVESLPRRSNRQSAASIFDDTVAARATVSTHAAYAPAARVNPTCGTPPLNHDAGGRRGRVRRRRGSGSGSGSGSGPSRAGASRGTTR